MDFDCKRCWAEVSRQRIRENFESIRRTVGPRVETMPVVKADAYGHGAVEVARVLEGEGAGLLAVSCVQEGVALREAGIQARIVLMSDNFPESRPAFLEYSLTPVAQSLEELEDLDRCAGRAGRVLDFHLKIDSGMGRMGTLAGPDAVAEALRGRRWLRLEGLMTHLASAGDYRSGQTERQLEFFGGFRAALKERGIEPRYVHAASSAPIAYGRSEAWHNLVRPGLALYGYVPGSCGEAPERVLDVSPALSWKARVIAVKEMPAGACIGYGATYRAPQAMRIAVVSAGYADGVFRCLSNCGKVIAAGRLAPIIGAVSMDVTTIDASGCPELTAGDTVTLLGREGDASITADDIANAAGTIPYEVLCRISARVQREYV